MNRKTQSLGLMANTNQANDELLKQIQSLFGEDTHDLTFKNA
jgi:hypothetical protein